MRRLPLLCAPILVLALVAACGGDDDDNGNDLDPTAGLPGSPATVIGGDGAETPAGGASTPAGSSGDAPLLTPAQLITVLLTPSDLGFTGGAVEDQSGAFTLETNTYCQDAGTATPPLARVKHFVTSDNTQNLNQTVQLLRPGEAEQLMADVTAARDACDEWEMPIGGQPWTFRNEDLDVADLGDETIAVHTAYVKAGGGEGAQDYVAVRRGDYVVQIWYTTDDADYDGAFAERTITSLVDRLEALLE